MEKKLDFRIEKTYRGLHNAFTALLEEKPFENITVNELCEKAMIRRTTFYKHFADKYEYFVFYCKEVSASFQSQLPPDLLSNNMKSYILQMCRFLFRFISEHQELVNNFTKSDLFPTLLNTLSEQITNELLFAMQQRAGSANPDPVLSESIAAFYSGGLLSMLMHWSKKGFSFDENLFIDTLSDFIVDQTFEKLMT